MQRCTALCFLLLIAFYPATAQHAVRGTIADSETGEPLPAAHVVIEGTYVGTITNGVGAYEISVGSLPATLVFRSIGYATERRVLDRAPDGDVNVQLNPVAYEMDEVVVLANPAREIMRRVIEEKQKWYEQLESFQASAYSRRVVENDTGIVFIVESLSDFFWDRDRGVREVLKSQRQTENLPAALGAVPVGELVNLYDDDVEIAGFRLVGVTHPRALDVYEFSLLGTRRIDDHLVYDIGVKPASRLTPAFMGQVTVLDSAFSLLEVQLRPNEAVLLPPPIRQFEIELQQQFSSFGGPFWLPVDFRTDALVEISFGALGSFPEARIHEVARLTDFAINVPLPDSLFDADEAVQVDSAAVAADTLLERTASFVPLEPRELAAYEVIDSTDRIAEAFHPDGLLGRLVDMSDDTTSANDRGPMGLGLGLAPVLRYNRVEGAHLGLRASPTFGPIRLTAGGGWSAELDGNRRWARHAEVALAALPDDRLVISVGAEATPAPRYDSRLYGSTMNGVYTLLGGRDYFDYYWRERLSAAVRTRFQRLPISTSLSFVAERPESLATHTGYDLFGHDASPRLNPPVLERNLSFGTLEITLGDNGYRLGLTGSSYVTLSLERGRTAGAWYGRYGIEAEHMMPVFNRRRLLPAALYLRLTAATSDGVVPLQRHGIVDGALGPYAPFGSIRTLNGQPYEGDHHLALFWEQSFRTLPFELLGLYGLARRGYTVLVHGAHGRTWLRDSDNPLGLRVADGYHHEIGLSLSGLFGLLRVDFTKRLDAAGFAVGVSAARLF